MQNRKDHEISLVSKDYFVYFKMRMNRGSTYNVLSE